MTRGYPQEPAAAYLGLGVQRFRDEVAAGRLPSPELYGKRLVWDKAALDRHKNRALDELAVCQAEPSHVRASDPVMVSIHAAKATTLRPADPS